VPGSLPRCHRTRCCDHASEGRYTTGPHPDILTQGPARSFLLDVSYLHLAQRHLLYDLHIPRDFCLPAPRKTVEQITSWREMYQFECFDTGVWNHKPALRSCHFHPASEDHLEPSSIPPKEIRDLYYLCSGSLVSNVVLFRWKYVRSP
jgi:hypothetical protein